MKGKEHLPPQFFQSSWLDDIDAANKLLFQLTMWGDPDDEEIAYIVCKKCLEAPHSRLRANAIQALGHMARVYGRLEEEMKPVIERALVDPDPAIRAQADSAAMDASGYLGWHFDNGRH
jgi:hypothetical protein